MKYFHRQITVNFTDKNILLVYIKGITMEKKLK